MFEVVSVLLLTIINVCYSADVVIRTPEEVGQLDGWYRLEYWPPQGSPPANRTFRPHEIANGIELSRALPGTEYNFRLFYTNASITDWLTWTASITTVPDPPSNLSISVRTGKVAIVSWDPPSVGGYSAFKLKVITLSGPQNSVKSVVEGRDSSPFTLRDLTPGASYEIQLFTVYENKESAAYISTNFTTIPNTPGRFIVWFRNETTLLVLWQPPFPPGVYSLYKVSIQPTDAVESVLFVEKEEPPGPAQAAFYGLIPGRAYNISVQTLSEDKVSLPTTAQYRTVPLSPRNVTYDKSSLGTHQFKVTWSPPKPNSEFDRYSVSIGRRRQAPQLIPRDQPREGIFTENILPGRTYTVVVKSVSGTVPSWPATGNVTTRPLPVKNLSAERHNESEHIVITWVPDPDSLQDSYKITYQDMDSGDASSATVTTPEFSMGSLLSGRQYSIAVAATSNHIHSEETVILHTTKPAPPIIKDLFPIKEGLNISWKSDVTSKQDSYVVSYVRNDTETEVVTTTHEPRIVLTNLYPGATYQIRIFAKSNQLYSEPHVYFQAVYPNPPRNLKIIDFTNSSIIVKWSAPLNSKFDHYVIKYYPENRKEEEKHLQVYSIQDETSSAVVDNLIAGEKYIVTVNSVSNKVASADPLTITQTVRPNSLGEISPVLDSHNVTFEWQRPEGRIDEYLIRWEPLSPVHRKAREGSRVVPGNLATEGIDRLLNVVIFGLFPGQLYMFSFNTTAHGLESTPVHISVRTMPLITSEVHIVDDRDDPRSLTLRYTLTPTSITVIDEYRFTLESDADLEPQVKSANDSNRKVTFSGLVPGRLYNITTYSIAGGVKSQPLIKQHRLYPEPITSINATVITNTTITLTWDIPEGDHNAYVVEYLVGERELLRNVTLSNSLVLRRLHPHKEYTFTVQVMSGAVSSLMKLSPPVSNTFTTRESLPGKVVSFHPIDVKPSQITFLWNLPKSHQNGILQGFTVTYGLKGSSFTLGKDFDASDIEGTIYNLIPGKVYNFFIRAKTKVGYGATASWEQPMPIWPPPPPSSKVFPTELSRTTTTIRIRYRKNYFSNQNGEVTKYSIIVAEDISKDSSGLELQSWWDVQDYSVWPPYQTIDPYNPFNRSGSMMEDFTIGADVCGVRRDGYCNGPLKSGTLYRVKIRGFTAPDKFIDTPYSIPIRTDTSGPNVVLGTVIPAVLVIIIVAVLLVLRRLSVGPFGRRKDKEPRHKDDALSIADSVIVTSRPVKLKDFADHYRMMAADSDFRFSEEYEELKHVGREQPCTAADLPVNRPKNRFTNILPYDHSRIKLNPTDDEEGSDYINANYVSGFNSPREFIVTQGPLHSTRDDFWRMVWESNSRAIVMLTRCIEKGREKCDYYWPYDTQPCFYGDIQVTILNESQYPDWTIREFRVQRGDTSRVVRHFHFTTWPDFGVPDPPQTLVRFVRAFRERVGQDQKPVVVHCSAGVGRSGTFIALDRLLQHMQLDMDCVDVFGIVYEMRRERVLMVQTEQQYICVHQCILAVLEGKENDGIPLREIHDNQGFEDDEGIAESGM